jgi:hypothetical protein
LLRIFRNKNSNKERNNRPRKNKPATTRNPIRPVTKIRIPESVGKRIWRTRIITEKIEYVGKQ